jgi:hypothetical protein
VLPAGARSHGTPPFVPVGNVQLLNNTVNNGQRGVGGALRLHRARPIPGDCGAGILLAAVADSLISGNTGEHSIDGTLIVDDFNPTHHNLIAGNTVSLNVNASGMTLPSLNSGAATAVRNPKGFERGLRDPRHSHAKKRSP